MPIFFVRTNHYSQFTGRSVWYFFEANVTDLADLHERLNDGHLVSGNVLSWIRDPEDESARIVTGRREQLIGKDEIRTISIPNCRFVQYEDEA